MRAQARIVAVADPVRGTRLAALRGEPPLLPRRTLPSDPSDSDGEVQLHLVGGAAGPLGGDDLRIEIEIGPDARLCVRSVAASLALPGPAGGESRLHVTARVAAGGRLRWLPEPLIGAAGCDHRTVTDIVLAEGAALLWREELVCGRYAEPVGDVRIETTLRYGGRTLFRNDLAVGPQVSGWSGPAVLDGARAVGSLLVVDPAWSEGTPPGPAPYDSAARWDGVVDRARTATPEHSAAAVLPLVGGPAVLVSAVGSDPRTVRAHLEWLSLRPAAPQFVAPAGAVAGG
ncbi:urease accessory protein UreD [Plantactinospora solaniradicis]|uniref:Urease accessory protein UreD n=1 Tax=Plantactinospora solaniradicis TaxID=1723736 RepID=A0ABW1KQH0_9ACTN